MKVWIRIPLLAVLCAGCHSARPAAYEDAIDTGYVPRTGWRASQPPDKPSTYEDAIDASAPLRMGWRPSEPMTKPSNYEDAIDTRSGRPGGRRAISEPDRVARPAVNPGERGVEPVAGG